MFILIINYTIVSSKNSASTHETSQLSFFAQNDYQAVDFFPIKTFIVNARKYSKLAAFS